MNSVIYDLQFGYRQKYSTCHALIQLTDKIREHDILIYKLNQYGIRGVANNRFSSYLQNQSSQYVSINGFNSKLEHIHCGVPLGSILGPLLFLIYINDLN